MRRLAKGSAAGVVIVGLALGGGLVAHERGALAADGSSTTGEQPDGSTGTSGAPTAKVERRDLVTREDYDGELGYTDERVVLGRGPGTLTWAAEEGSVVRPGAVLFRVDTRPVFYFSGGQPAWRTLEDGVDDGLDVRQLEQNLVALGYDPDKEIDVDTEFDSATEDAVERWQKATHQEETGRVDLGTVAFLPGPSRRIADVQAQVGGSAGGAVLTTTATRREASFALDATDAGLVREGQRVAVELPDGSTVDGRIRSVGRVAQPSDQGDGQDSEATIVVTVRLPGSAAADAFDHAPVTVKVETEAERDALAVPVAALLATAGGGYALEVVDGTATHLVAVELGAFADGYVQVTGAGIEEGTTVVEADL